MPETQFIEDFLSVNRGFEVVYFKHKDNPHLFVDDCVIDMKMFSSSDELIELIDTSQIKRVVIDVTGMTEKIDLSQTYYDDCRIFFISNLKENHHKILYNEEKTFLINKIKDFNNFFLINVLVQVEDIDELFCINYSKVHGLGLFLNHNVEKNQILFNLKGDIFDLQNKSVKDFNCEWNALPYNRLLVRKQRTVYGFINHSKKPNCYIDFDIHAVRALQNLQQGEELLLDYEKEPLPEEYLQNHGATYL